MKSRDKLLIGVLVLAVCAYLVLGHYGLVPMPYMGLFPERTSGIHVGDTWVYGSDVGGGDVSYQVLSMAGGTVVVREYYNSMVHDMAVDVTNPYNLLDMTIPEGWRLQVPVLVGQKLEVGDAIWVHPNNPDYGRIQVMSNMAFLGNSRKVNIISFDIGDQTIATGVYDYETGVLMSYRTVIWNETPLLEYVIDDATGTLIPEFQTWLLMLFFTVSLLGVGVWKRRSFHFSTEVQYAS